ncbi:MAG: Co2+/Mg2+ efflux protein ApaG [Rickettsiales bacterium]
MLKNDLKLNIKATPNFEGDAAKFRSDEGYVWTYDIVVENMGDQPVQILSRNWRIIDSLGNIREVDGEGVIGKKPIINCGERFQYSSFAQLSSSSGIMYGSYQAKALESGEVFTADIPAFSLDAPDDERVVN